MSQPPAFQLYVRDYLMSTRHLPPDARGIYMDLLCLSWDQDGIPADHGGLPAYLAITPAKLKKIWPLIEDKFVDAEDGRLRNPRQEKLRAEYEELRRKRAAAGRKGGQAKPKPEESK